MSDLYKSKRKMSEERDSFRENKTKEEPMRGPAEHPSDRAHTATDLRVDRRSRDRSTSTSSSHTETIQLAQQEYDLSRNRRRNRDNKTHGDSGMGNVKIMESVARNTSSHTARRGTITVPRLSPVHEAQAAKRKANDPSAGRSKSGRSGIFHSCKLL